MYFRPLCTALIMSSAALALSACATPAYTGPVEVTRFVGDAPETATLGSGSISLVPAPGLEEGLEYGLYQQAVAGELATLGYDVIETGGAQIAQITFTQAVSREDGRGPVSVGGGASTGSYGSGLGLGIGFNLGGGARERLETRLAVSIRDAVSGEALWEGRSSFAASANSDDAEPAIAAHKLAEALFAGFLGESGETVEVE